MTKRRAKFPHRLTWEWTKNGYHYWFPLRWKIKCLKRPRFSFRGFNPMLHTTAIAIHFLPMCRHINSYSHSNTFFHFLDICVCSYYVIHRRVIKSTTFGTDVIPVVWRFFVGAIARQLAPVRCFPMRCHRWNMASAAHTDDETLENTRELLFIRGAPSQNKIKNWNNKKTQNRTYV